MARGAVFEAELRRVRDAVRQAVYRERRVPRPGPHGRVLYLVVCDVCGEPGPDALHEILVTRGEARGNPALLLAIMHKHNCGEVHNSRPFRDGLTCHQYAATREGRDRLIRLQIERYGAWALHEWARSLPWKTEPTTLLNRLQEHDHDRSV